MLLEINSEILPVITHFGFVSYKEPWVHFKRLTDEYIFYFIKKGELFIEEDGQQYTLKNGDCILLQGGLVHRGFKAACCDYFYIHFKHTGINRVIKPIEEVLDEISQARSTALEGNLLLDSNAEKEERRPEICYLPNTYRVSSDSSTVYLLFMLKDAVDDYTKRHVHYKTLAALKLADLMIRLSREFLETHLEKNKALYPKAFVKCQALLEYLNNEYHRKMTSQAIEQKFEANYAYLNRVFQRMTGYTIVNYLNHVRMKKASELIENTSINFAEIGYLVGIDDPYYFSKLFKKIMGLSPTQYCKTKSAIK